MDTFHNNIICNGHIELVFSRILDILFQCPRYFADFFDQSQTV